VPEHALKTILAVKFMQIAILFTWRFARSIYETLIHLCRGRWNQNDQFIFCLQLTAQWTGLGALRRRRRRLLQAWPFLQFRRTTKLIRTRNLNINIADVSMTFRIESGRLQGLQRVFLLTCLSALSCNLSIGNACWQRSYIWGIT